MLDRRPAAALLCKRSVAEIVSHHDRWVQGREIERGNGFFVESTYGLKDLATFFELFTNRNTTIVMNA